MMNDGNGGTIDGGARLTVVMDDGGGEQECLSWRQCLMVFDGGWAFDGG